MAASVESIVDEQMHMWTPQREQRLKLGDRLDQPRELDHFAYFRRRKDAEHAAEALRSQGFSVEVGRRGLRSSVEAHRDDVLTDDNLHAVFELVIGIVVAAGGEYDGFGGTIVPA